MATAAANPYHAPKANVARHQSKDYGEIKVFSASGRIGRLRYVGYSIGLSILVMALAGGIGGVIGGIPGMVILGAGWVLTMVLNMILAIQRAHDFNTTGWLSIVSLVPVANFAFWLVPGTDGENEFGLQPPPNGIGTVIVFGVMPLLVTGILAALAIPAYNDYAKKAKAAAVQQQR
jgi:uncharacterized membrane protein YhaH (DUF805 family)